MENQEPTNPTGNLEELFRHHFAEVAVPPRPHVWEQIDNSLLIAQNETYRRRLAATRWVAAASLLLASLAGTGWWMQRDFQPTAVATTNGHSTERTAQNPYALSSAGQASAAGQQHGTATTDIPVAGSSTSTESGSHRNNAHAATSAISESASIASTTTKRYFRGGFMEVATPVASANRLSHSYSSSQILTLNKNGINVTHSLAATGSKGLNSSGSTSESGSSNSAARHTASAALASTSASATRAAHGLPDSADGLAATYAVTPEANGAPNSVSPASDLEVALSESQTMAPLSSLAVSMAEMPIAALPTPLAPQAGVVMEDPTGPSKPWQFGASYAAGVFQSNVNFSRVGGDPAYGYNPALGANSPTLSEAAAAEYRAKQRPGLSQRLRLQASRRLGGRWRLATGLEVAQQESYSSTSYIFTGEQIPDLSQPLQGGPRQEVSVRYRTAGVPVEIQYANPVKTGFSLYGRVGAVVSALLTTRSDVTQEPEATKTYTFFSSSTPYRSVMAVVRGAAGIQYRPAGRDYTVSLGPVAEGGIWSMNRHPAQRFFSQSRPYSFGLEAGIEFGHTARLNKL